MSSAFENTERNGNLTAAMCDDHWVSNPLVF